MRLALSPHTYRMIAKRASQHISGKGDTTMAPENWAMI
jgi:hypothetical protein